MITGGDVLETIVNKALDNGVRQYGYRYLYFNNSFFRKDYRGDWVAKHVLKVFRDTANATRTFRNLNVVRYERMDK